MNDKKQEKIYIVDNHRIRLFKREDNWLWTLSKDSGLLLYAGKESQFKLAKKAAIKLLKEITI